MRAREGVRGWDGLIRVPGDDHGANTGGYDRIWHRAGRRDDVTGAEHRASQRREASVGGVGELAEDEPR